MLRLGYLEGAFQIGGDVAIDHAARNRKPKDLAADLFDPMRRFFDAVRLRLPQAGEAIGRFKRRNRNASDLRWIASAFLDTRESLEVLFLVFDRRHVITEAVPALGIAEHLDIVEDILPGFNAGSVDTSPLQ